MNPRFLKIAVSTFVLAASAVSAACPIDLEVEHGWTWWSSWQVRMRSPRPRDGASVPPPRDPQVAVANVVATGNVDEPAARRLLVRAGHELAGCVAGPLTLTIEARVHDGALANIRVDGEPTGCAATALATITVPRWFGDGFVHAVVTLAPR